MVLRRCSKCGATSDDKYGFCIKCGNKFEKINTIALNNVCPVCGHENINQAIRCVKCGTPLAFTNNTNDILKKIVVSNEYSKKNKQLEDSIKPPKNYNFLIVFGYIFAIFGGIIGFVIAIYLSTRKEPVAKKHGHIQLGILVFYLILFLILYTTGNIDLNNYTNMLNNMSNFIKP